MTFDGELLQTYRRILQTTDLQKAYQEFVRWFRFLRVELEKQMPDSVFQGGIAENAMEYAYFQFSDRELKAAGLKLVVAFVHRDFRLEVWLSGVNRAAQCRWAQMLGDCPAAEPADDPRHRDYILRMPVETGMTDGAADVAAVRAAAEQLRAFWAEKSAER